MRLKNPFSISNVVILLFVVILIVGILAFYFVSIDSLS